MVCNQRQETDGFTVPVDTKQLDDVGMVPKSLVAQDSDLQNEPADGVGIIVFAIGQEKTDGGFLEYDDVISFFHLVGCDGAWPSDGGIHADHA